MPAKPKPQPVAKTAPARKKAPRKPKAAGEFEWKTPPPSDPSATLGPFSADISPPSEVDGFVRTPHGYVSKSAPPEATAHIEREHWLASEQNRNHLKAILNDPVFLAAAHYVTEANRVNTSMLVMEAMPDNVIARRAAAHAGCVEFIAGLKNLTVQKVIPQTPEPYAHIKSPYEP
jgi:hypothetical protein